MLNPEFLKNGPGPRLAFFELPDAKVIAETLVAFANTEGGMLVVGMSEADAKRASIAHAAATAAANGTSADTTGNGDSASDKGKADGAKSETGALPDAPKASDSKSGGDADGKAPKPLDAAKPTDAPKPLDAAKPSDAPKPLDAAKPSDVKPPIKASDASKITSEMLSKAIKEADALCSPSVVTGSWEPVETDSGVTVFALRVPRSIELHAVSDGRVLIRADVQNRPLGGQEILKLASAKSTGDFESEPVPGATKDDFSRKMIDEYLAKRAERSKRPYNGKIDDLLREIGAIDTADRPTVSGILLFSEYPQHWLPQSGVVFAKFVGKTPRGENGLAGYSRREELTGPLPRLIEAAWNLIWSEMAVSAVVKGLEREETTEYPQFAVREAIVNAVCHRDYRLKGRRIEIRMYSDRLEVISPGGLPGFITVENIVDEHFSRNPRIVSNLFQWGYIEELGLGIDRMMEVMEQAGHLPPDFDARPYSFAVTLQNSREKQNVPDWVRNTNHRQARALQYIRDHGTITNREYRSLCQGVSAETLRLDLADMVERGILLKVGSKKGTYYILK